MGHRLKHIYSEGWNQYMHDLSVIRHRHRNLSLTMFSVLSRIPDAQIHLPRIRILIAVAQAGRIFCSLHGTCLAWYVYLFISSITKLKLSHPVHFRQHVYWYAVDNLLNCPRLCLVTGVVVENFSYVFQLAGGTKSVDREQMRAFKKVWAEFANQRTGYLERHKFVPFFSVGFTLMPFLSY